MIKKLVLLSCVVFLVACQPSAKDIEKAIALTQTASPTETPIPTPTPIPLQDIDLSELLFQEGDLPVGYSPAQIRSEGIADTREIKEIAINAFHQDLSYQGKSGGRVSIYLYDTPEQTNKAYDQLTSGLESDNWSSLEVENLGERSFGLNIFVPLRLGLDPIEASIVTFVRCNALVFIKLNLSESYSGSTDYAKRLDGRLSKTICLYPNDSVADIEICLTKCSKSTKNSDIG